MTTSKLLGTFADTNNNDVVSTVGAQTVAGVKTFSSATTLFRLYYPSNNNNGGTCRPFSIRSISTDGGTNTPTTFCTSYFGASKFVLLAAFDSSGNSISFSTSTGAGSTFIVLITDAATNY